MNVFISDTVLGSGKFIIATLFAWLDETPAAVIKCHNYVTSVQKMNIWPFLNGIHNFVLLQRW